MRLNRLLPGRLTFAGAAFVWLMASLHGQESLPTRLLQADDLVHQGSFTIPAMRDASGDRLPCEYTQGVIAFNPAHDSLFLVCHDWTQTVAEIRIPDLGGEATVLQPPTDALGGRLNQINPSDTNSKKIGGMHVAGDRLLLTAYSFYDGAGSAVASQFVRSVNLGEDDLQGPWRIGRENPAFYGGYMAPIPPEWQDALGGALLVGQCCLSVISRTSYGPSVSSVNPADLLAGRTRASVTMLVGYPDARRALAPWESTGPLFNGTTIMRGVLLPAHTATVLFFGRHGMGKYCYGEAVDCGDPADSGKGTHAYPYEPHVWAYDAHDLAAVRRGRKRPWDLKPYATWRLPSAVTQAGIGGVTVDEATGRIFIAENHGDNVKPRIHVFRVRDIATP